MTHKIGKRKNLKEDLIMNMRFGSVMPPDMKHSGAVIAVMSSETRLLSRSTALISHSGHCSDSENTVMEICTRVNMIAMGVAATSWITLPVVGTPPLVLAEVVDMETITYAMATRPKSAPTKSSHGERGHSKHCGMTKNQPDIHEPHHAPPEPSLHSPFPLQLSGLGHSKHLVCPMPTESAQVPG